MHISPVNILYIVCRLQDLKFKRKPSTIHVLFLLYPSHLSYIACIPHCAHAQNYLTGSIPLAYDGLMHACKYQSSR